MFANLYCGALNGIESLVIDVEVDLSRGMPTFDIVGLPDGAIKEAKERVKSSFANSNIDFPIGKITVNLAPAHIKKIGSHYDLAIATGLLAVSEIIPIEIIKNKFFVGELSLDGTVKYISGILSFLHSAIDKGIKEVYIPFENLEEASVIDGVTIYPVKTIGELIGHLNNKQLIKPVEIISFVNEENEEYDIDFSYVKGQEIVKKAIVLAIAGNHNLMMIGPPGSGKTMMARRIPTVMPPLTFDESLEVTKIYSISNLTEESKNLIKKRPFRSPHHTISDVALIGGGRIPKPGEISLAHNGVLFLDEFTEFKKTILENMRQPLEDKEVFISRVNANVSYPSNFMLVASMNPCPCGYYGSSDKCTCSSVQIQKYLGKISGPMLDRIDIHIEANAVNIDDITSTDSSKCMSSAEMKQKVMSAISIQRERYKDEIINYNSELNEKLLEKYCVIGEEDKKMLKAVFNHYDLSARAYSKILRVARTIADVNGEEHINSMHLMEAVSYRTLDKKYWT